MLRQLQLHQPVQPGQDFEKAARFFSQQQGHGLPDAAFVKPAGDEATAEELPRFTLGEFGNFHSVPM
jgi:hypothetical protein